MIADFWVQLDPALQGAIIGAIIAGLLASLGSILTLFVGRFMRSSGRLHCHINAWYRVTYGAAKEESRSFTIRLHNEKDVSTTLWNLRFVFYKDGNVWLERRPRESGADNPIEVLDLPPQVTVTKDLTIGFDAPRGRIPGDELKRVKDSDKIEFVADIPGKGKNAFKEDLPLWDEVRTH